MSDDKAVAAVTQTLQIKLRDFCRKEEPLGSTDVTVSAPDKARVGTVNQVNLFLYQVTLNAAWRNLDIPRQVHNGEVSHPPLPLDIHYLVTVYGQGDDDVLAQRLLGRVMSFFHDNPLLNPEDLRSHFPDSDLWTQIERVRVTCAALSVDDVWRLWTTFQTPYRLSAAYQASVVLVESRASTAAALPVLARGSGDRGPDAQSGLIPPFPALDAAQPPSGQPSVRLGERLTLTGHHLAGDRVTVNFSTPRLSTPIPPRQPASVSAGRVEVDIGADPARWPAGIYGVSVTVGLGAEPDRTTNEVPFALAPRIDSFDPHQASGEFTLTVNFSPLVLPSQRASLLIGGAEIVAGRRTASIGSLSFNVPRLPTGTRYLRLRLDGVDSLLVKREATGLSFDPAQAVQVT